MRIKSVFSHAFEKYGKVLNGYDVTDLLKKLDETTKKPADSVIYEPGDAGLEAILSFFNKKALRVIRTPVAQNI